MNVSETQRLLLAAAQARQAGRIEAAKGLYLDVLRGSGEHPIALNALGMAALAERQFAEAQVLFQRAITADPAAPELRMNLAKACREQQDAQGERAALEGALTLDQRHFMALVRLAELHERCDEGAAAAERWGHVLTLAAGLEERSPAIEEMLEHARAQVAGQRASFADRIDAALSHVRGALAPADRRRVDACLDHALGRRQIYANRCAGMHFPFLPADEFFDRRHFPWLDGLEAQTGVIRDEFLRVMAEDEAALRPYVAMEPGTPPNKWSPLDGSLSWGALHLWKDGFRDDAVCARFTRTAAVVEALPLSDLPGRTPTVFFSVLKSGTHLPAHTGVSNVRAIVHLPLVVPPKCAFRVGGETRAWEEGHAWVFDDTIEHEAWNRSDVARAILILDVWNPHITAEERDVLRAFFGASMNATDAPLARLQVGE